MKGGLFLPEYSTVPVKVSYNNGDYFETYFYLNAILLDKIEVVKEPDKTYYKSGEKISYRGIDVMVTYQDASYKVVDASCTFDPPEGTEFPELEDITTYSENQPCLNVSIKYAEGKDEKECTLTLYAITFVLEIKTQPTKIKYHAGENISYSGLVVNAVYSDESVEDVTSQCSFSVEEGKAFDPLTDTDVEISYKGQTCNLTLKEASGGGSGDCTLTVTTPPTTVNYSPGDKISYEGMVAKIVANDGTNSEFDVTSYCDFSPAEGTVITEDINAEIKAAPPLTPIEYDYNIGYIQNGVWTYENPTKTYTDIYKVTAGRQYSLKLGAVVGSRFRAMFTTTDIRQISSGTVTGTQVVNVNNPSSYATANNFTAPSNGYILIAKDNVGVSGLFSYLFDLSATSTEKTENDTIELKASLEVRVLENITVTPPAYTSFRINEILDYSGCKVIAHYTDGYNEDVSTDVIFSPPEGSLMNRGLNHVDVSYRRNDITKTGSFEISVATLTALEIVTPPATVIYAQNEQVDYTGITVNAVYSDNGTSDVTRYVDYSVIEGTVLDTIGEQTITVSYRDAGNETASTELKIKVYEKIVKSLTITPSIKTEYNIGDYIDLTGCVVIANYSDDTTADVTASCIFSPDNNEPVLYRYDYISISYTENEVTINGNFPISVKPIETEDFTLEFIQCDSSIPYDAYSENGIVSLETKELFTEEYKAVREISYSIGDYPESIEFPYYADPLKKYEELRIKYGGKSIEEAVKYSCEQYVPEPMIYDNSDCRYVYSGSKKNAVAYREGRLPLPSNVNAGIMTETCTYIDYATGRAASQKFTKIGTIEGNIVAPSVSFNSKRIDFGNGEYFYIRYYANKIYYWSPKITYDDIYKASPYERNMYAYRFIGVSTDNIEHPNLHFTIRCKRPYVDSTIDYTYDFPFPSASSDFGENGYTRVSSYTYSTKKESTPLILYQVMDGGSSTNRTNPILLKITRKI